MITFIIIEFIISLALFIVIKKLKFESNFCWFSEDIFGKIPVQISIIFCTQKTERQKFIDFGQNILWALCEWNAMINTLKYTK